MSRSARIRQVATYAAAGFVAKLAIMAGIWMLMQFA